MPKDVEKKEVIIAQELAKKQREISVSEFFTKNRHLLGFDTPVRALLMTVKEAVDNSLDACNEAKILPELRIEIKKLSEDRFKVLVEDNGPGIVKEQIPRIFAKLLYGSKFHRLRMSRGQQGIGISASVLYSQLTTGKPSVIISKIHPKKPAHYYELKIDTAKNEPLIVKDEIREWNKEHGTRIEIELEAKYQKGKQSVDEFIRGVAIVNPQALITYITPDGEKLKFDRVTNQLPIEAKEIMPHPYGLEMGTLIKMMSESSARTLSGFLTSEFCRIGPGTAKEMCEKAGLAAEMKPRDVVHEQAEKLFKAMQEVKVIAPPTDCLSPIGSNLLEAGLKKEVPAEFYVSCSRTPVVYRGFPFAIEVGIAYGGELDKEGQVKVMRFANRVPLLYQQGACAISKAVGETNWKPYGLNQSGDNLPSGPAIIVVHMASVWVPFTSEAKDAIAHYEEIMKEIKLALQECGRKLGIYIRKHVRAQEYQDRLNLFEKYIPEVAGALASLSGEKKEVIQKDLEKVLKKETPNMIGEAHGEE
ncbi:MAG: DNA topoisomerase VI subunit B [Nanoarchaeota archaeon]|nr:DNA topoisomerase VI subunit B [Nanoarchaeota archaeon]